MASFLDLPAEIRNEIYKLALDNELTYDLREQTREDEYCKCLLFASREIRDEFLPMWRASSKFEITTTPKHLENQRVCDLIHQKPLAGFKFIQKLTFIHHLTSSPHRMSATGSKKLLAVVLQINGTTYSYETEEIREHGRRLASVVDMRSWMVVDAKVKAIRVAEMLVKHVLEEALERKLTRVFYRGYLVSPGCPDFAAADGAEMEYGGLGSVS